MARNVKWSRELTFHGGTSHLCRAVRLGEPTAATSACLILSLAAVADVAGRGWMRFPPFPSADMEVITLRFGCESSLFMSLSPGGHVLLILSPDGEGQ